MRYYLKVAVEHFAFGLILPVTIIWKLHNGLNLLQAAETEALVLVVTAIFNLPAGIFADRYGNKQSLLVGGLLHTIGLALLAYGSNMSVFIVAALFTGIAWAFTTGADEAYIHDDYIQDKTLYQHMFATALMVDEVTTVLGMLGCSLLLFTHMNLRLLFIVAGACLFANMLYTYTSLPNGRRYSIGKRAHSFRLDTIKVGVRDSYRLLPLFIAFAILYESGRVLWQPQLANIGIRITDFGFTFACFKLLSVLGSFVARKQAFSTPKLIAIFVLMSLSLALFGVHALVVSVAALTVFLATENYFRVYMSTALNNAIQRNRATLLSFSGVATNIIGSFMIVTAGFFGKRSILIALLVLVASKLPAVAYVLWSHRNTVRARTETVPDLVEAGEA